MDRKRASLAVALAGFLLVGLLPGAARATAPEPRVDLVVGPVGSLTESYRRRARAGAEEARRWTSDVVEIYSPDATWPRVRAALQGASIVVYLGHGNGFPSPYGTRLRPSVQDGFGLNPVTGRGDADHQYFGEGYLADQVELAPGATVLLFHLCYASGLAEPGIPEGSEAVARQRVDNFAAGFLAAGAAVVVADAYAGPASYLHAMLGEHASARTAWNRSSTANGHARAFSSQRTPGALALVDPESPTGGFSRSLVLAEGAASGVVPAGPNAQPVPAGSNAGVGAAGTNGGWELVRPPDPTPTLDAFDLGARPGAPTLEGMPQAGSTLELDLPVEVPSGVSLGTAYRLGTRWIPLDEPVPAADPAAGSEPTLVAPEAAASLVDVVPATTRGSSVVGRVALPSAIGRYRLEVTIHDGDGVALGWAVQVSIPEVVVHVGGPGAAWLDVPPVLSVVAGTVASIQVGVTNGESASWGDCPVASENGVPDASAACAGVRLVGRWLPVADGAPGTPDMKRDLHVPAASGATVWLGGAVPSTPGTYLLVIGVERRTGDSRAAVVGRPAVVAVSVEAAPLVPTWGT